MKYLTFLEFEQLESTGKNIELKLEEKDREIAYLRDAGTENKELMTEMSDRGKKKVKTGVLQVIVTVRVNGGLVEEGGIVQAFSKNQKSYNFVFDGFCAP